jgi:hypothetical protein
METVNYGGNKFYDTGPGPNVINFCFIYSLSNKLESLLQASIFTQLNMSNLGRCLVSYIGSFLGQLLTSD